jgi:hypothetical protein
MVVAIMAAVAVVGAGRLAPRNGVTVRPIMAAALPSSAQAPALSAEQRGRVHASLDALPLAFEANQGQTDPQVKYMARGNGYTVFLTGSDTVFALHSSQANSSSAAARRGNVASRGATHEEDITAAISMKLVGGNRQPEISAASELPGHSNYFVGSDPSKWQQGVKQYAAVSYRDVYPGVNMAFHGQQRQLEFDFIVAPGANAAPISMGVTGAKRIATDGSGNLVLSSAAGNVLLHKPFAYQEKNGTREPVDARFMVEANNQVGFALGNYDRRRELVIDPSVGWSTYLGGTAEDDGYAIAVDSNGNAIVTGQTHSTNFPIVSGGHSGTNSGLFDVFVTKISADGTTVIYSTYVGGSGNDSGNAIALDASGDAFVAGATSSTDFPHTGGYQTSLKGTLNAFVFELSSNGSTLTYSTYLGGSASDSAGGIAVDASGETYIVGQTTSTDFPTLNPIQSALNGTGNGFVTKLNSAGSALVYSTFLGGGSADIASAVALDPSSNAYVTGSTKNAAFPTTTGAFQTTCGTDGTCNSGLYDAFVSVIKPDGSGFVYSTFLGGENNDEGFGIAADAAGDAYVTGLTASSAHFPLKSALQGTYGGDPEDAFVSALNPTGSALIYSTYLGGSSNDTGTAIAIDENKNVYVTGQTGSSNFKTAGATQGANGGGNDAFVSEINSAGSLVFSTYLGGTSNENSVSSGGNVGALGGIAVDNVGANIYVTGNTASSDFPVTGAIQGTYKGAFDAFVTKYTQSTFGITATTPAAVTGGTAATSTVTLTSYNGYSKSVTLTCTVTGTESPLPTCGAGAFSPGTVTPTSGGATSTLTITTSASAQAAHRAGRLPAIWLPLAGLSLFGMCFVSAASRRRRVAGILLLGLAVSALVFLPACSSSSSSGGGGCTAVPSVPGGLAASATSSTGTTLNWSASTVSSSCTLTGYAIYQNGTQIGTSTTPTFNVTGLAAGTTYSFTVAASDGAGMSAQSTPVSVTTSGGTFTVTITGTDSTGLAHSTQVLLTVN